MFAICVVLLNMPFIAGAENLSESCHVESNIAFNWQAMLASNLDAVLRLL